MSNEMDVLIVGQSTERFTVEIRRAFRHWQVYSLNNPGALYGRRFRRAYFTEGAQAHHNWERMSEFLSAQGEVRSFESFEPEIDPQEYQDADLLRQIKRSRYTAV